MSRSRGAVYLVGAGPGDPGLITVRGLELLRRADVVIHDRLIPRELLGEVQPGAVIIDAGKAPGDHKLTQDQINALLVEHASAGQTVVRLKGGDPFVFGRGYEELLACHTAGIECEIVPGVSSAVAAPAAAGVPLTHRGLGRNFAVVTARTGESPNADDLDYAALARMDTVVVLMGRAALRGVAAELMDAGMGGTMPVACIQEGTTTRQRVVTGTLQDIAERADEAELSAPMVMLVGQVARFARVAENAASFVHEGDEDARPLARVRVVVTGSNSLNRRLGAMLKARGAKVIECPMVAIRYACDEAARRERLGALESYDWIVFASVHGVRGFLRALRGSGRDLRGLAGAKIAAVGRATAAALGRAGLRADLVPAVQTAAGLVNELKGNVAGRRVLLPCGDMTRKELAEGLSAAGARVERAIVYKNSRPAISKAMVDRLKDGFEAIVFGSPTAVERFSGLGIGFGQAMIACMGPTTTATLRAGGREPEIVPDDYSTEGLVAAMVRHYQASRVMS